MERGLVNTEDLRDKSLPVPERVLWAVLCIFAGCGNTVLATELFLRERTGCSPRRLKQAIKKLVSVGKISVENGCNPECDYIFTIHRNVPVDVWSDFVRRCDADKEQAAELV